MYRIIPTTNDRQVYDRKRHAFVPIEGANMAYCTVNRHADASRMVVNVSREVAPARIVLAPWHDAQLRVDRCGRMP
jgi:hypothetical protein